MADQHYSDLQVDHASQYPKYPSPGPYEAEANANSAPIFSDKIAAGEQPQLEVGQPRSRKRICGLAAKTFYVMAAIIAVIVIAAAVGGGVGGSLAGKSHNATPANGPTSASSQPPSTSSASATVSTSSALITSSTTTPTSTISISTSTTIGPSETLLVDCPSSNNTLYTPPSSSELWRKICSRSYLGSSGVGNAVVNAGITSLNDCIALAAAYNVENATEIADGSSNVCNAVCWRATITGDDYPGTCFGFTTTNSSGNFVTTDDVRCDSAALINQSF